MAARRKVKFKTGPRVDMYFVGNAGRADQTNQTVHRQEQSNLTSRQLTRLEKGPRAKSKSSVLMTTKLKHNAHTHSQFATVRILRNSGRGTKRGLPS